MSRLLIVVFAFLVGAVAGGYWGEHYSHTAIALRRVHAIYLRRHGLGSRQPLSALLLDFDTCAE